MANCFIFSKYQLLVLLSFSIIIILISILHISTLIILISFPPITLRFAFLVLSGRKIDFIWYMFFLNVGIYHYKLPFSTPLLFPINCGTLYFHFNLFKYILKFLFWFHFCLNGCSRVLFNFQTFGNFPLSSYCFISLCFE